MGPAELLPLLGLAKQIDSSPKRIASRFIGMSGEEVDVGIPGWAWGVAAAGIGVVAGIIIAPKLKMTQNSIKKIGKKARKFASRKRAVFGRF